MSSGTNSSTSNSTEAPLILKNVGNKTFTTGLDLVDQISNESKRRREVINDDEDKEVQNTA